MSKLISNKTFSLGTSKTMIDNAIQKGIELGVGGAITVVDNGGHLI